MQWNDIATFLMSITAILGILFTWVKLKPENRLTNASTLEKYESLLAKAAKREEDSQSIKDSMTKRIFVLESKQSKTDQIIQEWTRGINRLIAQLKSLDQIPVWKPEIIPYDNEDETIES